MRILVVTGSSGGHIFPAVSFLKALKDKKGDKEIDALLALPKRGLKSVLPEDAYKVKYLCGSGVSLRLDYKFLIAIFKFMKGALESLRIIIDFQPDAVVGFGSIDSIPMLMLAWFFRIKTLIHEQNVMPGRANRLLARFVDKVAVSFTETKDYLKVNSEKIILTGNPIRQELKCARRHEALDFFGFSQDKFTVLVMGGSQGSHAINTSFLGAVSGMSVSRRLQVIHLAGGKEADLLGQGYKDLNLKVKLFAFLKEMQYAYSASDLAISRAGATTIAELIFFRLPAIIIPYPFAYRHQLENAGILKKEGCAIVIEEDRLSPGLLREALGGLMDSPDRIKLMRSGYEFIAHPGADELLVKEVLSF